MKFIDLTNLKENLVAYKEKVVAPEILATAKNGVFSKNEENGTVVTIEDKINELEQTAGNIVIEESTDDDTVLKSYVFKKNDEEIGTINIPKDLVVTSGEVVKVSEETAGTDGLPDEAGTFMKLTIANQETPIFIDVRDLVPEAVDIQAETETIDWDSDING